jgi:hypothetical protein
MFYFIDLPEFTLKNKKKFCPIAICVSEINISIQSVRRA